MLSKGCINMLLSQPSNYHITSSVLSERHLARWLSMSNWVNLKEQGSFHNQYNVGKLNNTSHYVQYEGRWLAKQYTKLNNKHLALHLNPTALFILVPCKLSIYIYFPQSEFNDHFLLYTSLWKSNQTSSSVWR